MSNIRSCLASLHLNPFLVLQHLKFCVSTMLIHTFFVLFVALLTRHVQCEVSIREEQFTIDNLLPKDYDPQLPPIQDDLPVDVEVKVSVLSLRSLSEQNLCFTADLFVHYTWKDYRLNIDRDKPQKIVLREDWRNRIWRPETVFKNGISGEYSSSLYKTTYFVVNEQQQIFQASRLTVVLLCDFDFKNYPHDSNVCSIDLMALSFHTSKMILRHGNFTLSRHLYNNDFTITKGRQIQCNGNNDVGQFSCLRSEVRFDRNFGHFLVKTYVPSCIIVLTAIFGFWVPPSAYPQRVTLYMSAMIALFTMQIQNTNTIKPSYIVSIQIWMTSCVVFVFICLLEFLIASTIDMKNKQLDEARLKQDAVNESNRHIDWNANKPCDVGNGSGMAKFVELPMPDDKHKRGFASKFKQRWAGLKERLVHKGYTGRRIDNGAKFWVTFLFAVWIGIYTALVANRT